MIQADMIEKDKMLNKVRQLAEQREARVKQLTLDNDKLQTMMIET